MRLGDEAIVIALETSVLDHSPTSRVLAVGGTLTRLVSGVPHGPRAWYLVGPAPKRQTQNAGIAVANIKVGGGVLRAGSSIVRRLHCDSIIHNPGSGGAN